jgi:hypothetical protein
LCEYKSSKLQMITCWRQTLIFCCWVTQYQKVLKFSVTSRNSCSTLLHSEECKNVEIRFQENNHFMTGKNSVFHFCN